MAQIAIELVGEASGFDTRGWKPLPQEQLFT